MKKFKKISAFICAFVVMMTTLPVELYNVKAADTYVDLFISNPASVTEGRTITFNFNYTGQVLNVSLLAKEVILNGFTGKVTVSGTGNTRKVTISNVKDIAGDNYVRVTAGTAISTTGKLENGARSSSFSILPKDSTAPKVNLSNVFPSNVIDGSTIKFTATYSDDVAMMNVSLLAKEVILNGFTGKVTVSGTGNTRTITISNVKDIAGDNSIRLTAGTSIDTSGNLDKGTTSSKFVIKAKDTIAPTVSLSVASPSSVLTGKTVTFTATYADNVAVMNVSLLAKEVILNGFTGKVTVSGTGNTRTITISNVKDIAGDNSIRLTAGTSIDTSGNLDKGTTSSKFTIKPIEPEKPEPEKPKPQKPDPEDWIPNPNTGK